MARMIAIYKPPKDKEAFLKHYYQIHVPMAKKLPGLRKYDVSKSPVISTSGDSETWLIGTLHFDSLDAIKAAFATSEGQACAADRKLLAPDDDQIQIYLFDTEEV
ncbi:MAG: EthD family reductase [Ginsengibacter sp.]